MARGFWKYLFFGALEPGFGSLFETWAVRAFLLIPFVLQFSKAGTTGLLACAAVCWLLSGVWYRRASNYLREPVFLALFVPLPLLYVAGLFYTVAQPGVALAKWGATYHFLILPIALSLFTDRSRKAAFWSAFNLAMLLVFAMHFYTFLAPPGQTVFVRSLLVRDYITTGIITLWWCAGWLCFPFASRFLVPVRAVLPASIIAAMDTAAGDFRSSTGSPDYTEAADWGPRFAVLRWVILGIGLVYLFGICRSRTAHASFLLLLSGLLVYRYHLKGLLYAAVGAVVLLPAIWFASPLVRERFDLFASEWKEFDAGAEHPPLEELMRTNSTHARLLLYQYGWEAFRERPVFGWGTGSIAVANEKMSGEKSDDYAHSEYIAVALQWGMLGLLTLFCWLAVLARRARQCPCPWGELLWCGWIIMVAGMFMTDLLTFGIVRTMNILLLAVVLAPERDATPEG